MLLIYMSCYEHTLHSTAASREGLETVRQQLPGAYLGNDNPVF